MLRHFGKAENDLGTWFDFGFTKEGDKRGPAPFKLRVRRIPASVVDTIDERHKGREAFEVKDGLRRRVRDLETVADGLVDKAAWAWTDAEGLEIEVADEEGATWWTKALGREVAVGERVKPSGRELTAEVKKLVISELKPFALTIQTDEETGREKEVWLELGVWIVGRAAELQRDFVKAREADQKN